MSSYISRFSLAVFALAALASSARATSVSAIYAFGDSLSDAGNAFIATGGVTPGSPYKNGEFSNGPVWVQDLAASLGLPPVTASLAGGTDYAVGGAESGNTPVHTAVTGDLTGGPLSQVAAFQLTHPGGANPNGLYTIWIGSNDLSDIFASSPTPTQAALDVKAVITNIDNAISALAGDGAKDFLVVTAPDLGKTPAVAAFGPGAQALASSLSAEFDLGLVSSLSAISGADPLLNLNVLDTYSLIDTIVADPGQFGFSNVTDPCLTGEVDYSGGTPCSNPNQYLFWDQLHPTAAGQAIVAADAFQTLAPEPTTLTMLGVGVLSLFAARRSLFPNRARE
jgi:phospholipase/lecithinase/hemolysin